MARFSRVPAERAKAAFVAALRRGALVVEAGRESGVALWSLYRWRRADPAFDAEWTAAAEASSGWVYEKRPGEKARLVRAKRRLRFAGARREAYLEALATNCHAADSAATAGVHPSTIYRHLRRDPGFAGEQRSALDRGYERLAARLEAEAEAVRRRWAARPLRPTGSFPEDFDEAFKLLRRWDRPARPRVRRGERPRGRARTFYEEVALLERKLRHAFGIPDPVAPGGAGAGGGGG